MLLEDREGLREGGKLAFVDVEGKVEGVGRIREDWKPMWVSLMLEFLEAWRTLTPPCFGRFHAARVEPEVSE